MTHIFRPVVQGSAVALTRMRVVWFVTGVHAFTNGQAASLVFGQRTRRFPARITRR